MKKTKLCQFFFALTTAWLLYLYLFSQNESANDLNFTPVLLPFLLAFSVFFLFLEYLFLKQLAFLFPEGSENKRLFFRIIYFSTGLLFFIYLFVLMYKWFLSYALISDNEKFSFWIKAGMIILIFVITYELVMYSIFSYLYYTKKTISTINLEKDQIDLQLEVLKSHLSPHFLFNGFNTISSLAHDNQKKAKDYIRDLAGCYQYSLEIIENRWISVEKELDFAKSYLQILQARYPEGIQLTVNLRPEDYQKKLPPLALQTVIENAVKHNTIDMGNPLIISLESISNGLLVKNNVIPLKSTIQSSKSGLKNLNSRYALLSDQQIIIKKNSSFSVTLPLIS